VHASLTACGPRKLWPWTACLVCRAVNPWCPLGRDIFRRPRLEGQVVGRCNGEGAKKRWRVTRRTRACAQVNNKSIFDQFFTADGQSKVPPKAASQSNASPSAKGGASSASAKKYYPPHPVETA
jgi:hypothetical protein